MMINEPTNRRKKPNCIFKLNHVVIAEDIKKGEELTLYYGKHYDEMREKKNYTVSKVCSRADLNYPKLENLEFRQ